MNLDADSPAPGASEPQAEAAEQAQEQNAAEQAAEQATPEAARKLAEQVAQLLAEKDELFQTLVRRQADFENYRKRIERERKEVGDRAITAVAESLLPVLDGFERALEAHQDPAYEEFRKGFELIYRQLREILSRHGITRLETEGTPFDPRYHHAVERVESEEHPDGTVLEELQSGYKFRDRVLRPAMVRVAIRPTRKPAQSELDVN